VGRFLVERQTIDRFAFDIELMAIASMHGIPIQEVGVSWRNDTNTRVRFFRDSWRTLRDLVKIKANIERGLYK
jgi:hypothetical protein